MRLFFDEIIKETEAAWLLKFDKQQVWISKNFNKINETDKTIEIPKWMAIQKGIEDFSDDD